MLLHTEFSLLSLLKNEKGVIQHHGLFSVSEMWQNVLIHSEQRKHGSMLVSLQKKYFTDSRNEFLSFHRIWLMKRYYPIMAAITTFTREH